MIFGTESQVRELGRWRKRLVVKWLLIGTGNGLTFSALAITLFDAPLVALSLGGVAICMMALLMKEIPS